MTNQKSHIASLRPLKLVACAAVTGAAQGGSRHRQDVSSADSGRSAKPVVLLVAQEMVVLRSYLRGLRDADARIIPVDSAADALDVLARGKVDVVVADHSMPGIDGIRLLEEAKASQPETVGVLIAESACCASFAEGELEERIRKAEIQRFVVKPCDSEELRSAVLEAIRCARSKEPAAEIPQALRSLAHAQLFHGATEPAMLADLEGNILEVNHAFVQSLGGIYSIALARRPTLVSGLDVEWAEVKASLDRDGSWSGEVCDHTDDRFAVLSVSVVSDEQHRPFALAACERDVTAGRRAERDRSTIQQRLLLALSNMAEFRDPETGAHLRRIRAYCRALALELARLPRFSSTITMEYARGLDLASPLHDVGKVGIPDEILLKPGKLTNAEFAIMRMHSQIGAEILGQIGGAYLTRWPWLGMAQIVALQHHEKFNGTGYPQGLRGEQIDLAARIVALADVYDAITSDRVYQKARSHGEARRIIIEGEGAHFDPDVVNAFLSIEPTFQEIRRANGDSADDGVLDPNARRRPSQVLQSIAAILDAQHRRSRG